MKFKNWLQETVSNPVSWVAPALGGITTYQNMSKEEKEKAEAERIQNERMGLLQQGLSQGAEKAKSLYGMGDQEIGSNIQDIAKRRKDLMEKPSRAAEEVRSRGAQQQRQIASRGGSEAQKRQAAVETSASAGLIEDQAYQQNLESFQRLMGNIAGNTSALQQGYGQLAVASQYVAPPTAKPGLLGSLLDPFV